MDIHGYPAVQHMHTTSRVLFSSISTSSNMSPQSIAAPLLILPWCILLSLLLCLCIHSSLWHPATPSLLNPPLPPFLPLPFLLTLLLSQLCHGLLSGHCH